MRSFLVGAALVSVAFVWACGGEIASIDGTPSPSPGTPNDPGDSGKGSVTVDSGISIDAESGGKCAVTAPPLRPALAPGRSVAEICAYAGGGAPAPSDTAEEILSTIVGRWISCASPTEAIEMGGNGRYQALDVSVDGSMAPKSPPAIGRYNVYSDFAQVNVLLDGATTVVLEHVAFPTGADALTLDHGGSPILYARVAATAANGTDNPPPVSDGTCTLTGTWYVESNDTNEGNTTASLSFDDRGNFIGADINDNLCQKRDFSGQYALMPGSFQITQSVGMGCNYDAFWTPKFDDDCFSLTLTEVGDNCTGARNYVKANVVMSRR